MSTSPRSSRTKGLALSFLVAAASAYAFVALVAAGPSTANGNDRLLADYSLRPVSTTELGTVKAVWLKLNDQAPGVSVSVKLGNRLGPLHAVSGHCMRGARTAQTSVFLCRLAAPVDVEFVDRIAVSVHGENGDARSFMIEPRERS